MSFFRSSWITKTRKPHRCGWCATRIEVGSAAEYSAGLGEDFWAMHLHPECAAARDAPTTIEYIDLSEGWEPGDFSRGRIDSDQSPPEFSPDYRGPLHEQTRKEIPLFRVL